MAGLSPDAYRRAAGYRRSEAQPRRALTMPRVGPVQAFDSFGLDSPVLAEFLRGGREGVGGLVSDHLALRNSTFFRGFNLIVSSIGMLPTFLMRKTTDKNGAETIEKAKDHPLYRLLKKRPNSFQTAFEFKAHMQGNALFDGNAYALKVMVGGKITALVPLPRGSVTPKLSDTWQLTFEYRRPGGGVTTLQDSDVFHFRHPITRDGVQGISLVEMATNALGIAAQAEKAAGKILSTGMIAGGALETTQTLGAEAIDQLRESMAQRRLDAESAGDWLVLEEGLTAKQFATAAESQYDEMRQRQAEEIARIFGVPRPLLMFDETSWGSGIEQLGQYFVLYCLMPWMVAWEQAVERSCLTAAEQDADELYVKFNEGALIRGSLKDQADFFKAALGPNQAYRSVNEVRSAFDLNPKSGTEKGPDAIPMPTAGPQLAPTEDPKP